jgi:hypothetical protein
MKGNCQTEPSAAALGLKEADLAEYKPGRCVLVTDFRLMTPRQQLWLDSLHVQHLTTNRSGTTEVIGCFGSCHLWLTSMALRGDGTGHRSPRWGGVSVAEGGPAGSPGPGQLYAEGMDTVYSPPIS